MDDYVLKVLIIGAYVCIFGVGLINAGFIDSLRMRVKELEDRNRLFK